MRQRHTEAERGTEDDSYLLHGDGCWDGGVAQGDAKADPNCLREGSGEPEEKGDQPEGNEKLLGRS